MCNTASCPVCGGCEAEDALLSIMQFADQAPDPTADPYGAEAAFGRIVEMARAASQERPQPNVAWRGTDDYNRLRASQERPSIDLERLATAMHNVGVTLCDNGGPGTNLDDVAAEYLRLSGPVGE